MSTMNPKLFGIQISDFPIDIRIRMAELKFFCPFLTLLFSALLAVSAKLSKPTGQKISKVREQQKRFNSNLNSKQLRFHIVRPNLDTKCIFTLIGSKKTVVMYIVILFSVYGFLNANDNTINDSTYAYHLLISSFFMYCGFESRIRGVCS